MDKTMTGRVEKRKLPPSAQISKRPLLHPAIPSPYSSSSQQKVIYVGSKTPFISAVKRAEKLLRLSDKRLVQAGTQLAKKRRRGPQDEIQGIAEEVEYLKKNKRQKDDVVGTEEVTIKGTGKAIAKVMELGLWFQQREEYTVRLKTGSVGAVDDVSYEEEEAEETANSAQKDGDTGKKKMKAKEGITRTVKREESEMEDGKKEVNETRIRQLSVLEVHVSLR